MPHVVQNKPDKQPRRLLPQRKRRESILLGAANAFSRSGFAATSMEEVAAASGITKLIVYRHFRSKAHLYTCVLEETVCMLAAEMEAARERNEEHPGLSGILAMARSWPSALKLLVLHAPREKEFAAVAQRIRSGIVRSVEDLSQVEDPLLRRLSAELRVSFAFDAVLSWLELGDPSRDAEFLSWGSSAITAMIQSWERVGGTRERLPDLPTQGDAVPPRDSQPLTGSR